MPFLDPAPRCGPNKSLGVLRAYECVFPLTKHQRRLRDDGSGIRTDAKRPDDPSGSSLEDEQAARYAELAELAKRHKR